MPSEGSDCKAVFWSHHLMFVFLVAGALAFEQTVTQLSSATFKRVIENRKPHEVWMVMFTGQTCPACKQAYPHFQNASKMANGMIRFGIIDAQRAVEISETYDVRTLPHFRIFHSKGSTEYVGKRKARAFINQAASFIEDLSQEVDKSWLESLLARPAAVLFTDKDKTPAIWAGISSFFHGKSIRIGVSRRNDEIRELCNVSSVPAVVFMNGTHTEVYDGKVDFSELRNAIEQFFAKRLANDSADDDGFLLPADFEAKCLGGKQNCILYVSSKADDQLEHLVKRHARHKLKWFVGTDGLPYEFMKKGGVWIYNPRRDGFVHVDGIDNLEPAIERMLDGGAKWVKRDALVKGDDL